MVNQKKYCIYLITNLVNGKIYVGKSVNLKERWNDHKKVARGGKGKYPDEFFAVHSAMAKYDVDNFSIEIIDDYYENEDEAYIAETAMIQLSGSNKKSIGYNCNLGGKGGISPSKETMKKLIIAQNKPEKKIIASTTIKQVMETPEWRANNLERMTGNQYTKGAILTDEHKKKISDKLKGRVFSDETKRKMSEASTGEGHSQAVLTEKIVLELRKEFSELTKGKKQFMEVRGKKYGVSAGTIENVVYKLSWRHI